MSTLDRINRARWSREQRQQAQAKATAERDADRLTQIEAYKQQLAAFEPMAGDPVADKVIAFARDQIARLS
jgi:hypothetical protein